MSIRVRVEFRGVARLQQRITNAINFISGSGVRSLLQDAGKEVVREFRAKIDSFDPGEVTDLAESTKKQKQRLYGRIYPILKATGQMYNGMRVRVQQSQAKGWALMLIFPANRGAVAEAHVSGTAALPRRDFMKLSSGFRHNLLTKVKTAIKAERNR